MIAPGINVILNCRGLFLFKVRLHQVPVKESEKLNISGEIVRHCMEVQKTLRFRHKIKNILKTIVILSTEKGNYAEIADNLRRDET